MRKTLDEDLKFGFECKSELLTPELAQRFQYMGSDDAMLRFVESIKASPASRMTTALFGHLRSYMSDYDAYGLLNIYAMHLLSTSQWETLIGDRRHQTLLDVGAGCGLVTDEIASIFQETMVTETSKVMTYRLRKKGYKVFSIDLAHQDLPVAKIFDVVTCLNVIDRCARPISLIKRIRNLLSSNGLLVLAVPLPLNPFTYVRGRTVDQYETLPVFEESWEKSVVSLVENVIQPLGFVVEKVSRVPYLSQGDSYQPLYKLDDVILVCRTI